MTKPIPGTAPPMVYKDRKRAAWLLSLLVPGLVTAGPILQRHSDHHAHPLRRYQSLRHFDQLPRLPSGYFGMFLVAYCPPLWRRLIDKRLLAAVGHNAAHINMDPRQRASLVRRFQLRDTDA